MIKKGELEESKSRLYFNIGHVFDISQTNAKATDLPEIFPNRWLDKAKLLQEVRDTSVEFIQSIEKDLLKERENTVEKKKEEPKEQVQDELFLVKYEVLTGASGTLMGKKELADMFHEPSNQNQITN